MFEKELSELINKHSMDNECNTPDYILANYLMACLMAFKSTTDNRELWFNRK